MAASRPRPLRSAARTAIASSGIAVRQQGDVKNEVQAEKAAGIGETDGDEHGANERDADGRRLWEIAPRDKKKADSAEPPAALTNRQSKDVTGTTGVELDLTG